MNARHRTPRTAGLLVIAVLALPSLPARAEVAEITVSKEYGIGYLPYMIMEHQKLVTMTPENVLKYASFMQSIGAMKNKPASWKELFFPNVHSLPAS